MHTVILFLSAFPFHKQKEMILNSRYCDHNTDVNETFCILYSWWSDHDDDDDDDDDEFDS
jgi:hypothetical protein